MFFKKFFMFLVIVILAANCSVNSGSSSDVKENKTDETINKITYDGRFAVISNFKSDVLNNSRRVRVYLPENYNTNTDLSYDVLYLDDGQNVFRPGGTFGCWFMEDVYNQLRSDNHIPDLILVGIDHVNRTEEYNPYRVGTVNGNASNYLKMITDELIPFLEKNFRIKTGSEHSAFMGS